MEGVPFLCESLRKPLNKLEHSHRFGLTPKEIRV